MMTKTELKTKVSITIKFSRTRVFLCCFFVFLHLQLLLNMDIEYCDENRQNIHSMGGKLAPEQKHGLRERQTDRLTYEWAVATSEGVMSLRGFVWLDCVLVNEGRVDVVVADLHESCLNGVIPRPICWFTTRINQSKVSLWPCVFVSFSICVHAETYIYGGTWGVRRHPLRKL